MRDFVKTLARELVKSFNRKHATFNPILTHNPEKKARSRVKTDIKIKGSTLTTRLVQVAEREIHQEQRNRIAVWEGIECARRENTH